MSRSPAIAALLAALALAACADGDEATTSAGEDEQRKHPTKQVVIQAAGDAFDSQTIYETVAPGVVTVRSIFAPDSGAGILGGGGQGQGSGFVISDSGEIVTNAHVVTDADRAGGGNGPIRAAREVFIQFPDHNQVEAEILGFDPFADVALLKVDPEGIDLTPLPLGSESDVEVGEPVAAIGSPFGQQQSLSVGIISATDRSIDSLTEFSIEGALQTDASINPGNSGGPLLDAEGEVVGINQQINTTSGGNEGVGFAVPIDLAQRSIEQLRGEGEASYAYAGVSTQPLYPQLAKRLDIDTETGALVSEVVPGSPADEAGLQGGEEGDPIRFQGIEVIAGGDVIVAVDGERIVGNSDLPRIVSLYEPGDTITLDILRGGESEEIEIELGERPASP